MAFSHQFADGGTYILGQGRAALLRKVRYYGQHAVDADRLPLRRPEVPDSILFDCIPGMFGSSVLCWVWACLRTSPDITYLKTTRLSFSCIDYFSAIDLKTSIAFPYVLVLMKVKNVARKREGSL